MDYDDNECEDQNLHLASEESSEISSVLRPFALPKFDFDDSLHGHLRFDSLVENEVFLGIPSQEDNSWIEDFSWGSSGIAFSSSPAESCSLPRHINIWSETTSTDSVELLLKADRLEEMASDENTIEESCPVVQPGSSMVQIDNLTVDSNAKDGDNGYDSITPGNDIQVGLPRSDQNVAVKDDAAGPISPAQEISFPFHEVLVDGKNSDSTEKGGKLNVEMEASSIDQVETGDLLNQVEENLRATGTDIKNTESSSPKASAVVGESVNLDNLGDNTSLAGSSDGAVHIPDSVEVVLEEGSKEDDIETSTVEADEFEPCGSLEAPSQMEPSKEEHIVKTREDESAMTDNEVVQDVKLLEDKSPLSYDGKEESVVGLGADTNDVTQNHTNTEPKPDVFTQSSVQLTHDDVIPGSNSSFVNPPAIFFSSMSPDLPNNPPAADLDGKIKDDGTSGHSTDSTVAGPLPAANMEMCREDHHLIEEDVCEREQADPACDKEGSKSSVDKKEICDEKEKETGQSITANTSEQIVETASGCQPDEFTVTSCTDTIAQLSAPNLSSSSPSKCVMNVEVSLEKSIIEKVGEVLSTSSVVTASCQAEESFTFDVRPLGGQSTLDNVNDSLSLNAERTVLTSGNNTLRDPKLVKETSGSVSVRKPRRGGSRSGKGSMKRENQAKETPAKPNGRGDSSTITVSPLGAGQLVTFDSAVKQRGSPVIATSNLPDLKTLATSTALFRKPFTDSQQMQLRAQIFVYGLLIQGVAPDEACMVSAFDGARLAWEPAWRTCIEKRRGQKSRESSEAHGHLFSGVKGPEPTNSQGFSSGTVRSSNKTTTTPVINPAFSLSSPLWSIATPSNETINTKVQGALFDHQAVSPLHPFQSPSPIRNFTAHTTWSFQSPFPVPWLASSQSSPFGISTNYSTFPVTESVRLTPVKDSSSAFPPGTNLLQAMPPAMHTSAMAMFSGASSLNPNMVKASSDQDSLVTKTRKRKKSTSNDVAAQGSVAASPVVSPPIPPMTNYSLNRSPALGDGSQFPVFTRNNVNVPSTSVVNSQYSTSASAAVATPFVRRSTTDQLFSMGTTMVSHDTIKTVEQSKDMAAALNADGFKKVEDAKLHVQEAASCASEAIQHCESMWNQMKHQNYSGLTEDVESKLASAAAAVAAAACVAKAASAAANVALSAAVQAKLLAEEAVSKSGAINTVGQDVKISSSTMYGTPSLEVSSSREASRRKVEAASTATRHANNRDAIVKAAELAAEAVSHAGKIVVMSDPFSVRELIEAGPNNYWRVLKSADEQTTVRTGRSVPDKGGSRVVFGVPKAGKKRKFMEVSKHYVSDGSSKDDEPDDSMKLARFLAPHGSRPRRLKNVSKVDKERQAAGSKDNVPKFGKPPSVPGRTILRKDESSSSRENEHDENSGSDEEKLAEIGSSNIEETSGREMVFSSKAHPKENRKKLLTKGGRSERLDKVEHFPTSGKVAKTEANEKINSQVTEPRRSNRRIQPTSRLLEGLQSSLVISKPPSSSRPKP